VAAVGEQLLKPRTGMGCPLAKQTGCKGVLSCRYAQFIGSWRHRAPVERFPDHLFRDGNRIGRIQGVSDSLHSWPQRLTPGGSRRIRARRVSGRLEWDVVRNLSGACIRRVIDRSGGLVAEHAHDWPVLSFFVLGSYQNGTELGESLISGPSAILYRAGSAHSNKAGPLGFEQIEIEFDPDWLGRSLMTDVPVSRWLGGPIGAEARTLARPPVFDLQEERLRAALRQFVKRARYLTKSAMPPWVHTITGRLRNDASLRINELSLDVQRHPSWVGTAYRRATGEGLTEVAARVRVERAAWLLRETDRSAADIAQEAGFCDQSHMNRTFRRVLARTPSAVRMDRFNFRHSLSSQ
jgi:AraC family transcriptional regulator